MGDHTSDEEHEEKVIEPLPPHRVRFTDMPWPLVDKTIRRKYTIPLATHLLTLFINIAIVCEVATGKCRLDKELASEIQT